MSWPLVRFSEIVTVNPRLPKDTDETQLVSFVAMASASEEGFLLNEEHRVLAETKKGFTYFEKGDVLLAKITPCFENGKCLRANQISNQIGFGSTEFHVLRANPEKMDSTYLFYMVWSARFRSMGEASMSGAAGQKRVGTDFLKGFEIPLPPLTEQKRIAAILDKADAIRCKRQQAIQLADEFLRAVFLDMFGDPVTNPKGWEIHKMSDVIEFKGGHQPPKNTFEYEEKEGYVRLIQIRDFKTDKFKTYIPEKLAKRKFDEGDVMIARYGPPVFQILRGLSGSYNVALMKASPKGEITNDFIFRLLQLPAYHDTVVANSDRTAGQTGVNLDLLNNFDVPLPPVEIQENIISNVKKAEIAIEKMRLKASEAANLFASLSQKAFCGEL